MMRSMYSGVSGLQVHQVKMDVIGNNIANVNTVGYKSATVSFSEVFAQTVKGAGAPQGGRGGTNPQQIGLGTGLSAVSVKHTKGSTNRTNNPTDIMIDGNGFFVVTADENALNKFYTRAGNFSLDKQGYLVNPEGFKLLDSLGVPIRINKSETKAATASTEGRFTGNLNFVVKPEDFDAADNSVYTTTFDIFDSVGQKSVVTVKFGEKLASNPGGFVVDPDNAPATMNTSYRSVLISGENSDGSTVSAGDLANAIAPTSINQLYAEFDDNGTFIKLVTGVTIDGNNDITAAPAAVVADLTLIKAGAEDINVKIDTAMFEELTHYANTTDMKAVPEDGMAAGALDSFAISAGGEVVGTFTNGERKTLATIGLASFDNAPGLMKVGGNLFTDTPNSGTPKFGSPGTGSFGALAPGALEMSNVDLSAEFTEMITTQRGFQANSRVITTTDEMLQELVNLKR